ncbi:MAG TPA: hypothetical protein VI454_17155 [Verrucomicrobiae bacterium]|jgi:hypothetical protein
MKILVPLSAATLLAALTTTSSIAAESNPGDPPDHKWRVGVSLSLGFNASANFSRLAPVLPPPPPPKFTALDPNLHPNYDDGYTLVDSANDGMNTIYWGYFNDTANQNVNASTERLTLHRTVINQPATALTQDTAPLPGLEVNLNRDLCKLWRGRFGLEGVFGFLQLNIRDSRDIMATGTLTSDVFSLHDSAAQYFNGNFPNDYQGVFGPAVNVPFIPITPIVPERTTMNVVETIHGTRLFDATAYFWRLGAYWETPLTSKLSFAVNGGATLTWIHSTFTIHQTTQVSPGGLITEDFSNFNEGFQVGGYFGMNLRYALSDRWSLLTGARFEKVGEYHNFAGGKQAELVFGKSVFLTAGVSYSF